jgi:hypothetical protein
VRASDDLEAAGLAVVEPASNTATSHPRLCYPCDTCGALVGGAYQSEEVVSCPRCAGDGDRDRVARAILWTAGLLGPRTS